jgi:hypothetical protein
LLENVGSKIGHPFDKEGTHTLGFWQFGFLYQHTARQISALVSSSLTGAATMEDGSSIARKANANLECIIAVKRYIWN